MSTWTILPTTIEELKRIALFPNKNQYIRLQIMQPYTVTVGSKDANGNPPVLYVEGLATGGSINVDGKSAVRRNGSLSFVAGDTNIFPVDAETDWQKISNITKLNNLIAMDKEIKVSIGIQDADSDDATIYEFPQGIFVIKSASISYNNQGLTISCSIADRMALLNGEIGGVLSNAMMHSPMMYDSGEVDEDGNVIYAKEPVLFVDIIKTLVKDFGGLKCELILDDFYQKDENGNIKIDSATKKPIVKRIQNIVRWVGTKDIYTYPLVAGTSLAITTLAPPSNTPGLDSYGYNDNIGYQYTDFTYPGELSSNAGETIVSVLEKIKNALGNYEYFFNLDGNFVFQKIPSYIDEGSKKIDINSAIADNYLYPSENRTIQFEFDDATLITAYQNQPQWNSIKNDLTVWGKRGDKTPIWFHFVINQKRTSNQTYWNVYKYKEHQDDTFFLYSSKVPKYGFNIESVTISQTINGQSIDWRSRLCLDYICGKIPANSYWIKYGKELESQWPRVFNIENNTWLSETDTKKWLNNLTYYFDFLDWRDLKWWSNLTKEERQAYQKQGYTGDTYNAAINKLAGSLKELTVEAIGSRPKVLSNDKINTIFSPTFPEVVYIEAGQTDTAKLRTEAIENKNTFVQVPTSIAKGLSIGSALNSAYDNVRAMLHETTSFNETISVSCIPIFHLQPNQLIYVKNEETGIDGDYMLNSFSIPLDINGVMNLSCSKALRRI